MKTGTKITIILVALVGITTFAFINKTDEAHNLKEANETIASVAIINQNNGKINFFGYEPRTNQNLAYMVQGRFKASNIQDLYSRSITQEKLSHAKLIDDIIENYPSSFIRNYRSVVIETTINGENIKESSSSNILTEAQKELLRSVPITSGIVIMVNYNKMNYNDVIEKRQMKVSMGVVPEIEAEYVDGYNQMIAYLKKNSLNQIEAKRFKHLPQPSITFVVNEMGETENVKLTQTSRDTEIDELLIKLVKEMPKWTPAKNAKGIAVKQEFVFNVGQDGC